MTWQQATTYANVDQVLCRHNWLIAFSILEKYAHGPRYLVRLDVVNIAHAKEMCCLDIFRPC